MKGIGELVTEKVTTKGTLHVMKWQDSHCNLRPNKMQLRPNFRWTIVVNWYQYSIVEVEVTTVLMTHIWVIKHSPYSHCNAFFISANHNGFKYRLIKTANQFIHTISSLALNPVSGFITCERRRRFNRFHYTMSYIYRQKKTTCIGLEHVSHFPEEIGIYFKPLPKFHLKQTGVV